MPTLIHLSDLHFGPSYLPRLGELILDEIKTLNPDAVVISGDFTMRARHREYQAARDFLDKISAPTLTIPGNHDQPLFAPLERLVVPFARYRKHIHTEINAALSVHGLFIAGLNDNRPILPGGFWSQAQRAWLAQELENAPRDAAKIVVTHHQLNWDGKWRPAGFWYPSRTLKFLSQFGVELVLNGHTHVPSAVQTNGVVVARASTATCSRTRHGEGNSYNLITLDEKQISIFIRRYDDKTDKFVASKAFTFPRNRHAA